MKKSNIALAVGAVLVVGAIIAFAQASHKGGFGGHHSGNHFGNSAERHEEFFEHITLRLNLTEPQKTRAKQIFADAKPRFDQFHNQLKESHQTMMNSAASDSFDERKAQETAAQHAEVVKQIVVEKEKTIAAIFAVLTTEQREQARKLMNENFEH